MAKFTDEERKKLIEEVANYIIKNNSSTRKAAEHFGISNATVSDWMNEFLKKVSAEKYIMVQSILRENMPKTVENKEVRDRVIKAAMLIKDGYTVAEIAKGMNTTINVINEDLETRLPRISEELYSEIKNIQQKNSEDNLKLGSNMNVENQKRDENGKFTK